MTTMQSSEVLDIIIANCNFRRSSTATYPAWDYQMWSPDKEKPYERLWARNVRLYSGEHARVRGGPLLSPDGFADFAIDSIIYRDHKLLEPGNVVTLLNPRRGNYPKTTYAGQIRVNVNGRNVDIHVPTLAAGRAIQNESETPDVVINGVREPSNDPHRPYYLLYAKFDQSLVSI